ncbi:PAS domain-containing protein [Caulobacter sp. 73W]|uniref:histidine kinase n=1 Tax=Caulobacter sp. 73W TaxID=3161137 RepID=A0AB39KXG3_9CAUL
MSQPLVFLSGGGETGAQIRGHDWRATPLGDPLTWPKTLQTAVSLMLGSAQPVYIAWGPQLISLYNDGYIPILGLKHPAGMGQPYRTLWAEIWDQFAPVIAAIQRGEAQHFVNLPIAVGGRPDRPLGYFTFSWTPLRDDEGRIQGFYCAATETTDQVLAEARLRETEQRLQMANRATNDAIWDWDLQRDQVTWNEAIERAYGHALSNVGTAGGWWIDHIHPEDRARIDASIHAVIDGDAVDWAADYRFLRGDGSYADVRDRGFVIRDAEGRPVRMVGAMRDQSERMGVERRLRNEASDLTNQIEQFWSNTPDLLVVADTLGVYQRANPAWKSVLGFEAEEIVGMSANDLVAPEDLQRTAQALAIAQVAELPASLLRFRHKDGGYRWISWVAGPGDGEIFAIGRDVTAEREASEALRAAEEALRQSQKVEALGKLTGGVAHDFNNLLTVIRGTVDLLRRPALSEERRERYIGAIAEAADRASNLTSQLLAFARRQTLQPQVFDASASIAALSGMLNTLLGSRIDLRYARPEQPCLVTADPTQFDTAIVNMAVNARDAMAGEGVLKIEVRVVDRLPPVRDQEAVRGDFVAISITDTGVGIAADKIDHIFEPFFTTKGVGQGTGLGLSQVFGFAKQSSGEVEVQSAPGFGSTFTLYLPLTSEAVSRPVEARSEARALEAGRCILLVEDNREVGDFARHALAELGHGVIWATDAEAALAELARDPGQFDLVFTDVVMPGRSGMDLADEILRLYPHLPVVLTSGYSHVLAQEGTRGYALLRKPYSLDELAETLARARVNWRPR